MSPLHTASDHVGLDADFMTGGAGLVDRTRTAPEDAAPRRGHTVLVVDDDADMRLYLTRCLTAFGVVDVVEAADGHAALERARQGGLDLIVSDVVMPRLDGPGLCAALHADAALRAIPVLLITGQAFPPALPEGAGGLIAKPFNAAVLRDGVQRLLGPMA